MPGQFGDPAAAAAAAAKVRRLADAVGDRSSRLDTRLKGVSFEGPAARRARQRVSDLSARTDTVATVLTAVADDMARAAAEAKAGLDAERRREAETRRGGGRP
jgi:hypothetical protein